MGQHGPLGAIGDHLAIGKQVEIHHPRLGGCPALAAEATLYRQKQVKQVRRIARRLDPGDAVDEPRLIGRRHRRAFIPPGTGDHADAGIGQRQQRPFQGRPGRPMAQGRQIGSKPDQNHPISGAAPLRESPISLT